MRFRGSNKAGLILTAILFAGLCIVFYWDVLLAPADQIVGGNDLSSMFQLWLDYARSQVHAGRLPLWNPYLFSGVSFLADPQPALFYPPTWLALLMPSTRALGLILVLHIWWTAVGTAGWLRSEGATWWGALAGAAVFAFSGYTFARIQAGHIGVLTAGSWLPWGLWIVGSLTRNSRVNWRTMALGAACVGLGLLAGHVATFMLVVLFWGIYALYQVWSPESALYRMRRLLWLASAGALGLLSAAVQLFPFIESILASTRFSQSDYEFASRFSWPIAYILTLFVPNFFGEPVRTGYWGEGVYDELVFYVGVLPMLLLLLGWRMRGRVRFWAAVSGAALLVAFGSYGVVHRLLFRFIPFFSTMRAPARAGLIFTLGAAAATAFALSRIQRASPGERRPELSPVSRPVVGAVLAIVVLLVAGSYLAFAWGRDSNPQAGRLWHLAGQVANFGLFFGVAAAYLNAWRSDAPNRWLPAVAVALIMLDLWTLGSGLVKVVPAPPSAYWRIVSEHTNADTGRVLPWGLNIFEQNGALSVKTYSVFGYNPMEDQLYNDFVSAVPDPRARAYDLLNAAYVVTKAPLELTERDTLSLMVEESGVYIYSRSTTMPRAWIVPELESVTAEKLLSTMNAPSFDPAKTALVDSELGVDCPSFGVSSVDLVSRGKNVLRANVRGGGGLLLISAHYAPGWRARLDGRPVTVIRANGVLQGVCVPSGTHIVQLVYRPTSFLLGLGFTGATLLALLLMLMRRSRPSSSENETKMA